MEEKAAVQAGDAYPAAQTSGQFLDRIRAAHEIEDHWLDLSCPERPVPAEDVSDRDGLPRPSKRPCVRFGSDRRKAIIAGLELTK